MPFSRERAALTEDQIAMAEAVDSIYETTIDISGGVKFRHLLSIPRLYPPMSKIVKLIAGTGGSFGLVTLLLGAAAAFENDNNALYDIGQRPDA